MLPMAARSYAALAIGYYYGRRYAANLLLRSTPVVLLSTTWHSLAHLL